MDDFALIFDMDGLLIDSEVVWERVEHERLTAHGATWRAEVARQHIGMRIDEAAALMVREYGLACDALAFGEALVDALLAAFDAGELRLMPGAAALLDEVAAWGGPVAIASSSPRRVVRHVVEHFGWQPLIGTQCAGDEVARGKPAPDLFLQAAAALGLPPARCIVLEDSLNGARAARAAGTICVAVPNPAYTPADFDGLADLVVPSLAALTLDRLRGLLPAEQAS